MREKQKKAIQISPLITSDFDHTPFTLYLVFFQAPFINS